MSFRHILGCVVAIHVSLSTQLAWPSVSYVTENFTSPQLKITRNAATAPGYLFFDPAGAGTTSQAPLITTDGELAGAGRYIFILYSNSNG